MSASIYFLSSGIVVHAYHRTSAGVGVAGLPACKLTRDTSAANLGKTVRETLAASRATVAHPTTWAGLMKPVLATAGIKSWKALAADAHLCLVREGTDGFVLTPTRNGGLSGDGKGFHHLKESAVLLNSDATDDEIGAALLRLNDSCR